MSKSSKQTSLFSFFTKSPADKKDATPKPNKKEVLSPKKAANTSSKSPKTTNTPPKGKNRTNGVASSPAQDVELADFVEGDVVWARLQGYPWWPSLVCCHPTEKVHCRAGRNPMVHVQFFDTPPTRAWIRAVNCKPFMGSQDGNYTIKGGQFYSNNRKVRQGAEEADKAMGMTLSERLDLVVVLQPSEDEDSEEEEEEEKEEVNQKMDFDPAIFDDEMEVESEQNSSKENHEEQEAAPEASPTKSVTPSPSKTPKKRGRGQERKAARNAKRARIIEVSDSDEDVEESGDEFKPESEDSESDASASSGEDEAEESEEGVSESEPDSPVKRGGKRKSGGASRPPKAKRPATSATLNLSACSDKSPLLHPLHPLHPLNPVSQKTKSMLASFSAPDASPSAADDGSEGGNFPHVKLEFLTPEKIRDKCGRKPDNPDFNPRTLRVPDTFLAKQTPGMRQWWELKADYYDTILFFKMGKFYELFHMDAVIGVNELGLIYMKGDYAHSGFPEIAYSRYADALVQKGYKVARIEQTETPEMMAERCKQLPRAPTKFEKVVKREVCQVTSMGTCTYSPADANVAHGHSKYLLAVCEKPSRSSEKSIFGVCFVDTTIGTFHLGQFEDDRHSSRLRTLLAHYTPVELLYERGKMAAGTMQLINSTLTSVLKQPLAPGTEFWDSSKTLKVLSEDEEKREGERWPGALKKMVSEADSLGLSASDKYDLAIRSLGAIVWYLKHCLVDRELLSMCKFEEYCPLDSVSPPTPQSSSKPFYLSQSHMVLDGVTMANLDVLQGSGGDREGSLLEQLDQCTTAFGKRQFHQWLCAPLCHPNAINERLDAVEDLMSAQDLAEETRELMKKLPDLERLLSRIHTLGTAKAKEHPDSRAILYEEVQYSKRKIEDFLSTLTGLKNCVEIAKKFASKESQFKSALLKRVMVENFPDIKPDLHFFDEAFDHDKAKRDGVIMPSKGVDADYDSAVLDIKTTEKQLKEYLDEQRQVLNCKSVVYWGTGRNRYQMEVPEMAWKRVPHNYELISSKKGYKRYKTPDIEEMLSCILDAEDRKDAALKDIMRRIFHSFDERYRKWRQTVESVAVLDCLLSLARYSRCGGPSMCRPILLPPNSSSQPFIEIREGRHPCISKTFSGGDFIPNDTIIGSTDENEDDPNYFKRQVVLVTGPNMGGKSTLMRQVGLIVVIAQMGCYVPAEQCRLSPVDRVFSRLGATDRIMAGESTFFVELSETSAILQHATKHSLVLMDELGRGTATYDGTAIACAVVRELSQKIQCRTLFSTHYHSLVDEFKDDANVRLGHMACMVEQENDEDPSQETITFLYKFAKGACPKSYGFNAARLASIPEEVIKTAVSKSKEFEAMTNQLKCFRNLWRAGSAEDVKKIQEALGSTE